MLRLNAQSQDIMIFNGQKLAFLLAAMMPLSWSLLINLDSVMGQDTIISNEPSQEVSDVSNKIIYVNPTQGNDQAQGKQNSPLKTITQALKNTQPDTVIALASGTYSEETGETFPLIIRKNITLRGTARSQGNNIIIKGGGEFISPTGAGQNVAIAIIKDEVTITGVTVTNPQTRGHGIWIESANPTVSYNSLIGNGNTGVSVNGASKPLIEHNYFFNNLGNGLLVYGTSQPQVSHNLFERTGFGVSVVKNGAVILQENSFKGNRIGIIFEGSSQGILRDNNIFGSLDYGLVAIANSRVDLGTNEQSGGNTFRSNGKFDIQNITKNSIIAVGTQVQGKTSGIIDFAGKNDSLVTINNTSINVPEASSQSNLSSPRVNPLPSVENPSSSDSVAQRPATTNSVITSGETLPPPPSFPSSDNVASTNSSNGINNNLSSKLNNESKELVFSAPDSDITASNNRSGSLLSYSNAAPTIRYRVLVEASNPSQQAKVRSLYPDAFRTVYQSKTMLQVGAFSQRGKAEAASRSMANLGLNSHILTQD